MAYFSFNEDFQHLGSFGCGEKCQCGSCAQRQAGRDSLAEWYKRDEDEPEEPASQSPRANNRPAKREFPMSYLRFREDSTRGYGGFGGRGGEPVHFGLGEPSLQLVPPGP